MADWSRTLEEVLDGMTFPQFRLLSKMRQRRVIENRRWDLQVASFTIQTKEQADAWADMMEDLTSLETTGQDARADAGGGVFTVSKRHPLLHEITPTQAASDKRLRRLIKFRTITEPTGGES